MDRTKYPIRQTGLLANREQYESPVMRGLLAYPDYGKRQDGTNKGLGYFGALKRPDGNISTELSIGVEMDGKERDIPALTPNLVPQEIDWLLNDGQMTNEIARKAYEHALMRLQMGLSPFAD